MERGDFADAVQIAEETRDNVRQLAPHETETMALDYHYLGEAYNGSGQYDKALDAYRQGYDLFRQKVAKRPSWRFS